LINNDLTGTIPAQLQISSLLSNGGTLYLAANPNLCYNVDYSSWAYYNDFTSGEFCISAQCPGRSGPTCSLPCAAVAYDHATWVAVSAGTTTAVGVCYIGYSSTNGHPSRSCSAAGNWSPVIANRCIEVKCNSLGANYPVSGGTASFPAGITNPGDRANGVCDSGLGTVYANCNLGGSWSIESKCQS